MPPAWPWCWGFTETALLPGISAAGATPNHRRYTALADTEFLIQRPVGAANLSFTPPLAQGASPVYITRAVVAEQGIPVDVFLTPACPPLRLFPISIWLDEQPDV